jgi:mRNA-degrading endonuclease YafQ of YafQ-DinJ toxin-antitoxin module
MSRPLIEIEGFAELQEKLKQLSNDKDKKKEILLILRQVAKPTVLAAQLKAPIKKDWKKHTARREEISPGNLKKSIGIINSKLPNPTIFIGPRLKGSFKGWYGHMVDKGHDIYNQRSSVFTRDSKGRISTNKVSGALTAKKAKRKGITSQGRVEAVNFLEEGFSVTEGLVTADAEKKITAFIQRRIDKLS